MLQLIGFTDIVNEEIQLKSLVMSDQDKDMSEKFVRQVNHGGLTRPSCILFLYSRQTWNCYKDMINENVTKDLILRFDLRREAFVESFVKAVINYEEAQFCLMAKCSSGHDFSIVCRQAAFRLFNFFGK